MKLLVEHQTLKDFSYEFNLYKMKQSSDLDFERFEELFDQSDEENLQPKPSFDCEWQKCEVNNLYLIFLSYQQHIDFFSET
jgi:hypothetical protein